MSGINNKQGIKPQCREQFEIRDNALSGDLAFNILTADVNEAAGAAGWTYTIKFEVVDSNGNIHNWINTDCVATPSDSSTLGTATVSDGTPALVNGVGTVDLIGSAAAWVAAEDADVTMSLTILGYTVTPAVFTVTIV